MKISSPSESNQHLTASIYNNIMAIKIGGLFKSLREEYRSHPGNRTDRKGVGLLGPTEALGLRWADHEPPLGHEKGRNSNSTPPPNRESGTYV